MLRPHRAKNRAMMSQNPKVMSHIQFIVTLLHTLQQQSKLPLHTQNNQNLVAFASTNHTRNRSSPPNTAVFDTNSFPIRIDNHCSRCISFCSDDFEGPLMAKSITFRGLAGAQANANHVGTLKWRWEDDMGQVHTHLIPDSVYLPGSHDRILVPQHWAQERKKQGLSEASYWGDDTTLTLKWGEHVRVTPLDSRTNVAILQSAPSFAAAFANVVSDEEDNSAHDSDSSSASEGEEEIPHLAQRPRPITFEAGTTLDVIPSDTIMEEQQSPVQLFLYWHYRLNHLPYS
jgi:hypothetical protein